MPGEDTTKNINFNIDSNGRSDVWLVFDKDNSGYAAFTAAKGDPKAPDGGLGRYGHFAVSNNGGGALFQSYNLQHKGATDVGSTCAVDANGNGGSAARPASASDTTPYCGVATAIKIAGYLNSSQGGVHDLRLHRQGERPEQHLSERSIQGRGDPGRRASGRGELLSRPERRGPAPRVPAARRRTAVLSRRGA